jgi:prevent-host-death family protein
MTMMGSKKARTRQYNVAEAKARLPQLVRETLAGDEVIIAKDNKPVVKLVSVSGAGRRKPGTGKGQTVYMAPDFDAPLEDFEDYM